MEMKAIVLFLILSLSGVTVVLSSIAIVDKFQKMKFELDQCQIEVVMQKNKVWELEAERDFVKKDLGVFYPKIKIVKETK